VEHLSDNAGGGPFPKTTAMNSMKVPTKLALHAYRLTIKSTLWRVALVSFVPLIVIFWVRWPTTLHFLACRLSPYRAALCASPTPAAPLRARGTSSKAFGSSATVENSDCRLRGYGGVFRATASWILCQTLLFLLTIRCHWFRCSCCCLMDTPALSF